MLSVGDPGEGKDFAVRKLDTSVQSEGGVLAGRPREERELECSVFYHKNALCTFFSVS